MPLDLSQRTVARGVERQSQDRAECRRRLVRRSRVPLAACPPVFSPDRKVLARGQENGPVAPGCKKGFSQQHSPVAPDETGLPPILAPTPTLGTPVFPV